jgi:ribosomal protein S18 acetylase RimI-like enzyme
VIWQESPQCSNGPISCSLWWIAMPIAWWDFARVLTDGVYLAVVLDVVVADDCRNNGLGGSLMEAILGHPQVSRVRSIELVCQPDLIAFYRRFGFTDQVGHSRLLRKSADPILMS